MALNAWRGGNSPPFILCLSTFSSLSTPCHARTLGHQMVRNNIFATPRSVSLGHRVQRTLPLQLTTEQVLKTSFSWQMYATHSWRPAPCPKSWMVLWLGLFFAVGSAKKTGPKRGGDWGLRRQRQNPGGWHQTRNDPKPLVEIVGWALLQIKNSRSFPWS